MARMIALAGIAVLAVSALAILGTWQWVSAIGADVNNDGYVSVGDIGETVAAFGQAYPTPPLPVVEQNVDGNGNIRVHEQGTVDVNVLSMPSSTGVLYEYTHLNPMPILCSASTTGFVAWQAQCSPDLPEFYYDIDAALSNLGSQGWELVEVTMAQPSGGGPFIYTLRRALP